METRRSIVDALSMPGLSDIDFDPLLVSGPGRAPEITDASARAD